MKENISKVIIIGGGIAGAIAAYVCVKSNINTIWFAPKSEVVGAIQVPPNSIRALKKLGCFDLLENFLTPISMIRLRETNLKQDLANIDVSKKYFTISRNDFFSTLKKFIGNNSKIEINEDKIVSIENKNGQSKCISSSGEVIKSDFIIGADGINGIVRRLSCWTRNKNIDKKIIKRALIKVNKKNRVLFQSSINLWMGDGWHLVYYPYSKGENLNAILVGNNAIHQINSSDNFELSLFENTNWQEINIENTIYFPKYINNNIILLGDAAHPMPPHLAQGAAQTFIDGAVLLDCLSKNDNISSSVENYSKLRLESIKKVTNMSLFSGEVLKLSGLKKSVRNRLILSGNVFINNFMTNLWGENSPL